MKPSRLIAGTFALALMLLGGCDEKPVQSTAAAAPKADALEKTVMRGPVELTVRVTPKEPRLSDTIEMEISARAGTDVEITPPPFGKAVGEFLVRDYKESASVENGKRIRSFRYKLEPVRTGQHLIRSFALECTDRGPDADKKDPSGTVESEPLELTVTSELGDQAPSLANLAPMAEPRELPPRGLTLTAKVLLGILVLATGAGVTLWMRRRQPEAENVVRKTPEEIAAEELKALLAENLAAKGLFKEFYVRLTGIVRRYIERTTGIHAPEQTTEEFLRAMRSKNVFPAERAQRLAHFLEAADLVKYAGMQPGERQIEEAVARAQEFVGLSSAFAPMPAKALEAVGAAH